MAERNYCFWPSLIAGFYFPLESGFVIKSFYFLKNLEDLKTNGIHLKTRCLIKVLSIVLSCIFVCGFYFEASADELGKFEDQFKKKKENQNEGAANSDLSEEDETKPKGCKTIFTCILGDLFKGTLSKIIPNPLEAAFKGPKFYFNSYPYESSIDNYVKESGSFGADFGATISSALQIINPDTEGTILSLDYRDYYRFGLSTDLIRYKESTVQKTSQLDFYSFYLFVIPIENNNLIVDTGIGGIVLSRQDHYLGPSLKFKWTWFPKKPFLINTHFAIGGLNWVPLWDLGAEAGVNAGPVEIYLGYRGLAGPAADLSGPTFGVRYWF